MTAAIPVTASEPEPSTTKKQSAANVVVPIQANNNIDKNTIISGHESETESHTTVTMDDETEDDDNGHDVETSTTAMTATDPPVPVVQPENNNQPINKPSDDNDTHTTSDKSEPVYEERSNVNLKDNRGCSGIYSGRVILLSSGDENDCVPDGYGTMIYHNNNDNNNDDNNNHNNPIASSYTGYWKRGVWHGSGQVTLLPQSDTYSGEFVNGQRHGTGTYKWSDGRSYTGKFWKDQRHGQGHYTWPGGASYEGAYHQGVRTGYGRYLDDAHGILYVGDWQNGKYHGYGVLTTTIIDDDEDHHIDNEDKHSPPTDFTKHVYRGNFVNGQRHGHGVEVNPDGSIQYDGEWNNGEPCHNKSTTTTATNQQAPSSEQQQQQQPKQESEFLVVENEPVNDANGLAGVYRGILHRASRLPHGNGTITYKTGKNNSHDKTKNNDDDDDDALDYYEGCFDMGRYHGRGRLYWKNGDSYDGEYVKGRRQGQGVYRWSDGRHYKVRKDLG